MSADAIRIKIERARYRRALEVIRTNLRAQDTKSMADQSLLAIVEEALEPSPIKQLQRLCDAFAEDILAMSDDEIEQEMRADGIDTKVAADEVRAIIFEATRRRAGK